MHVYVLTMWNEFSQKHVLMLHGPFEPMDDFEAAKTAAGDWGDHWDEIQGGNPMWQVVYLDSTGIPVITPADPVKEAIPQIPGLFPPAA